MSTYNRGNSPDFSIVTDEGKGKVKKSAKSSKFRRDDRVKLLVGTVWQGPYLIARVLNPGRYILCLEDGQPIDGLDSQEVDESDLVAA